MPLPTSQAPALTVPLLSGGTWSLAESKPEAFTIVVFYRGKHCPICKTFMKEIEAHLGQAAAQGIEVVTISMDSEERARDTHAEIATEKLKIGYGMDAATARSWDLYMSSGRPDTAEPEIFSEPGLFVIDPEGKIFFAQTQSAPFTRPDFGKLLGGLKFVVENNYPARGGLKAA